MNTVLRFLPKKLSGGSGLAKLFPLVEGQHIQRLVTTLAPPISIDDRMEKTQKIFINMCKDIETNSITPISRLQEKLLSGFEKDEVDYQLESSEIKELIALSCTDEEIDVLATIVRKHALRQINKHKLNYGKYFISLLVSLKKTDKIIELVKARENNILFRHHSTLEIILHYLLSEKLYQELSEVLVERLSKYFRIVNKQTNENSDNIENTQNLKKISHIPFSHMEMYTRGLLLQNTEKSYFMFKELVDYIYKNDGECSKHTVLRLLYFSIIKRHYTFGFDIFYTDLFEKDEVLKLNLFIMLHSRGNKEEYVIKNLKNIFNRNQSIYPFTFGIIREDIKYFKSSEIYKNNIDLAYKRALRNNLLSKKDFPDIVYNLPEDSPEIFALKIARDEIEMNTLSDDNKSKDRTLKKFSKKNQESFDSSQ